jgi:hypothetical protein
MNSFIGDYHPASSVFIDHQQKLYFLNCQHRLCFINCQHRLKPTPHIPPNLLKQVAILRKPDLSGLRNSAYEFIHRRLSSSIGLFHRLPASVETDASYHPKPAEAGCDPSET